METISSYLESYGDFIESKKMPRDHYHKRFVKLMDKLGNEIYNRHNIYYNSDMLNSILTIASINALGDKMFEDGVNDGRIVSFMEMERRRVMGKGRLMYDVTSGITWEKHIMPYILKNHKTMEAWIDDMWYLFRMNRYEDGFGNVLFGVMFISGMLGYIAFSR